MNLTFLINIIHIIYIIVLIVGVFVFSILIFKVHKDNLQLFKDYKSMLKEYIKKK